MIYNVDRAEAMNELIDWYHESTDPVERQQIRTRIESLTQELDFIPYSVLERVMSSSKPAQKPETELPPDHGTAKPGEYEGFYNYRSPFATDLTPGTNHWDWNYYRNEYASSGKEAYFNLMLKSVTADNPPRAVDENAEFRQWEKPDFAYMTAVLTLGTLVMLAVFGVIAWPFVAAMFVVALAGIFGGIF